MDFAVLGSVQFERLCAAILEGTGLTADEGVLVVVAWVRAARRLQDVVERARSEWPYAEPAAVLVLTNVDEAVEADAVLGPRELAEIVAARPDLRLRLPSVLGIYDVRAGVDASRSTFDLDGAAELARVFVPTRAYARAREVVERHGFVVLSGPPEMGKTAIARMLGLALMTDGWEVHECTRPEQLWERFARDRRQVFVADDAFGSTEYRADAAERWALELDRVLRALDERHRLIWTSRPAPLKSALRRIHREHGVERWPRPAEVHVDAAALDVEEKALILFRHAKAAQLHSPHAVRENGWGIVSHEHFTPERIRRFVTRLDGPISAESVARELREPTAAMTTSFRALEPAERSLLVALLDTPHEPVSEGDLAAAARRHGTGRATAETLDRLTDHFLRVGAGGVAWVHPSWRDLVIDELAADGPARRAFLHACGIDGVVLALSTAGGRGGERAFPLLLDDADWDALADRVAALVPVLREPEVTRLLAALLEARHVDLPGEVEALARYVLELLDRRWSHEVVPAGLVAEWFDLAGALAEPPAPPRLTPTWIELEPAERVDLDDATELDRLDEWASLLELAPAPDTAVDRARATLPLLVEEIWRSHWPDWPRPKRERLARIVRSLTRVAPSPPLADAVVGHLLALREDPELPPVELRPLAPELELILETPRLPRNDQALVARVLRDL